MQAIEFNIQYDGRQVTLKAIKGEFLGGYYETVNTRNQAWTNCHGETMVDVFGLNSSLKLSDCEVVN